MHKHQNSDLGVVPLGIVVFVTNKELFMTLTQERKQEIMGEYQTHETDTGSTEVQVALLTERINQLSAHLKVHKQDYSCQRGLMRSIGRRKRLLAYLQKENSERYKSLISRLGIRG